MMFLFGYSVQCDQSYTHNQQNGLSKFYSYLWTYLLDFQLRSCSIRWTFQRHFCLSFLWFTYVSVDFELRMSLHISALTMWPCSEFNLACLGIDKPICYPGSISKISMLPLSKKIIAMERTPMLSLPATGKKNHTSFVLAFVMAILDYIWNYLKSQELCTVEIFFIITAFEIEKPIFNLALLRW